MNLLSLIWDWIKSLFGFGESRYGKEEKELEDEMELIKLTREDEHIEKKEDKQVLGIIVILKYIFKKFPEKEATSEIRLRGYKITPKQAINVLVINLKKLIGTGASIKQEETTLNIIWNDWIVIGPELSKEGFRREIAKINSLFNELRGELKQEEAIAGQKVQLSNKERELIMKETGGKKPKQPAKVA